MDTSASGRPPQLDDRAWLARRYAEDGYEIIAREVGCSPNTVRRAVEQHGIPKQPGGRRRGRPLQVVPPSGHERTISGEMVLTGTALEMITRYNADRSAPSEELLAQRIKAAVEARTRGDRLAYEDALLDISSAAARLHDHQVKLRTKPVEVKPQNPFARSSRAGRSRAPK